MVGGLGVWIGELAGGSKAAYTSHDDTCADNRLHCSYSLILLYSFEEWRCHVLLAPPRGAGTLICAHLAPLSSPGSAPPRLYACASTSDRLASFSRLARSLRSRLDSFTSLMPSDPAPAGTSDGGIPPGKCSKNELGGKTAHVMSARMTGRYSRHPNSVSDVLAVPKKPARQDTHRPATRSSPWAVSARRNVVRSRIKSDVARMTSKNRRRCLCPRLGISVPGNDGLVAR